MGPIRILVVDDSAFLRLTLSRRLALQPDFEVVGAARDGSEAISQVQKLSPDVVTMDVEMPGMDGLEALTRIMALRPTPVIMVSSLTQEGTETTVRALTRGAVDFIAKPSRTSGMQEMVEALAGKIRHAAQARVQRAPILTAPAAGARPAKAMLRPLLSGDLVIAVGSSTGGPGALRHLMRALPATLDAAVVLVQHMPPGFTRSLADRLDEESAWSVKEASSGDRLLVGQALLAPGDYHLIVERDGRVMLTQAPPENNVRPAVDVTFRSLAAAYGSRVLGVILTGMGRDGTEGARLIRQAGGQVIVEDESTCAVFGMPRSAIEAGVASHVAPLPHISGLIHQLLGGAKA